MNIRNGKKCKQDKILQQSLRLKLNNSASMLRMANYIVKGSNGKLCSLPPCGSMTDE